MELVLIVGLVVLTAVWFGYRIFTSRKNTTVYTEAPYKVETPTETVVEVQPASVTEVSSVSVIETSVETKTPELKVERGGKQTKPAQRKPRAPKSSQPKSQSIEKKPSPRKPRSKTKPVAQK